jgi:hypothetical protein
MPAPRQEFVAIYDEFRDSELNKEYYAERVRRTRRKLRQIDIYLALFSGGSGVAGFTLWSYSIYGVQLGQLILGMLAGIATMVLLAKPYLKLEDEVERLSGIQSTYASMAHILKDVVLELKIERDVGPASQIRYRILRQIRGSL